MTEGLMDITKECVGKCNTQGIYQVYSNHFTGYVNAEASLNPTMLDPELVPDYGRFVWDTLDGLVADRFVCDEIRRIEKVKAFVDPSGN